MIAYLLCGFLWLAIPSITKIEDDGQYLFYEIHYYSAQTVIDVTNRKTGEQFRIYVMKHPEDEDFILIHRAGIPTLRTIQLANELLRSM